MTFRFVSFLRTLTARSSLLVAMVGWTGVVAAAPSFAATQEEPAAVPQADSQPPQQQTRIEVSKETTYFTEPLDAEGYVMLEAGANRLLASRTSPEDNGAIDLIKAIGCRSEANTMTYACERLEIEIPPPDARFIKSPRMYGTQQQWNPNRVECSHWPSMTSPSSPGNPRIIRMWPNGWNTANPASSTSSRRSRRVAGTSREPAAKSAWSVRSLARFN